MQATADQARALAHYAGMAAQAQLHRRATDERDKRRAVLRKAIRRLCDAEIAFAIVPSPEHAAEQFSAQMAVEAILGEMR